MNKMLNKYILSNGKSKVKANVTKETIITYFIIIFTYQFLVQLRTNAYEAAKAFLKQLECLLSSPNA